MATVMAVASSVMEAEEAASEFGSGEASAADKLRGLLLSLSSDDGPFSGPGRLSVAPHDTDWLVPLGAILVALFALTCITIYIITRWGSCKEHQPAVLLLEHKCLLASLCMVLFVVVSMGGLYYYFCFRGGCYGAMTSRATARVGGRKVL